MSLTSEIMNTGKIPESEPNFHNTYIQVFWRRGMFKYPRFEACLKTMLITQYPRDTSPAKISSLINSHDQNILIDTKCEAQYVNLTYVFNENFAEHRLIYTIPGFQNKCRKKTTPVILITV